MTFKKPSALILLSFIYLVPQLVWANLLIHPTRVNFQSTERSQTLTLANTSEKIATYQLMWKENVALSEGGYRDMEKSEESQYPIASQFIRFSPRQVTLRPGERQSVKLLLRRARNLEDGEYRSHLLFKALPTAVKKDDSPTGAPTMNINMVLNFAIPISLRVGDYNARVSLTDAVIEFDQTKNTGAVFVSMERVGPHSTYGDISAFWTPPGGQEVLLAKSAGHSLWTETNTYRHRLSWAGSEFNLQDGNLRIYYQGIKEFSEIVYINQTLDYKRENITAPPPPPTNPNQQ